MNYNLLTIILLIKGYSIAKYLWKFLYFNIINTIYNKKKIFNNIHSSMSKTLGKHLISYIFLGLINLSSFTTLPLSFIYEITGYWWAIIFTNAKESNIQITFVWLFQWKLETLFNFIQLLPYFMILLRFSWQLNIPTARAVKYELYTQTFWLQL